MYSLRKTVILLTFFSIAMGFLESAVVIYLRQLYYPHGFTFPLTVIPPQVALVEFLREAATVVMLATIGMIAGKNFTERFSFFVFCFAVWDIFYYIFLKVFLNWPESLFTWDILFLIPVPWVGPVLAPCIISFTMIMLTLVVVYFHQKDRFITISKPEWGFLVLGSIVLIGSFTEDYFRFIFNSGHAPWMPANGNKMFAEISNYVPQSFDWLFFIIGELLILVAMMLLILRHRRAA